MKKLGILVALCLCLLMAGGKVQAQAQKRVIQLSGIVMSQDSLSGGIPGVNIYVPKAGRGTATNLYGFFSLPVLVGDSLVISAVGYQRQYYIVPNQLSGFLTLIFELSEDVTYLKELLVTPFPTEEVFKEAVLALNLPIEENSYNKNNLDAELLALILRTTPMDGYSNQRFMMEQLNNTQTSKYVPVVNPLLNPFNWAKFIQSIRQNKNKKKK
ncbi:MAG: carboxypeptidase-like regulatory domain-containing protein [Chryseotalea sp.]